MRSLRFLLISMLWMVLPLEAQDYWFKHLGVAQNLVGSQVNAVCKDANGFVWIGTATGLSRYDGVTMLNFTSDFANASALPDNNIESIQEDGEGTLWIRSGGGYVAMNAAEEIFDRGISQRLSMLANNLDPALIFVDRSKNLWVYDKGKTLYYYKVRHNLIYNFDQTGDNPLLPEGLVTDICDAPEGVVVVYATGLVVALNAERQSVAWQNNVIAKNMKVTDNYRVFYDSAGNIWVYGERFTFFYDREERTWYRSLQEFCTAMGAGSQVGNDLVMGIGEDKEGRVWVATDRNGLLVYSPAQRGMVAHLTRTDGARPLNTNSLRSVYVDDSDVVWVGTQRHGLSYWASDLYLFRTENVGDVNGISVDGKGNVWLSTRGRGLLCKREGQAELARMGRADGLADDIFTCVLATKDGNVWVGSNRFGLSRVGASGTMIYNTSSGLKDDCIQALAEDMYGNVWVGQKTGGLQCINQKTGAISHFNVENGKLPSNNVTSLCASKNNLLVGTANGVVHINLSNNEFVTYSGSKSGEHHFTNNSISSVLLDSRGLLWVGTSEGLNLLDVRQDVLTVFSTSSYGLPSNTIYGLAEDAGHNIWVITNNAACRILVVQDARRTGRYLYAVVNYDERDGLQGMEFNQGALHTTARGDVFLGGQNGVSQLHARAGAVNTHRPKIILASLKVNGKSVRVHESLNGHRILSRSLNAVERLRLRHDERDVHITLSLSEYGHAEHPRFTYMIEGQSDDTWQPIRSDGYTLALDGLASGTYKVHIRGSLSNGKVTADERVLTIVIDTVWYKQWWFYLLLLLLLAAVAGLWYRFAIPALRMYRRRREAIHLFHERKAQLEAVAGEVRQDIISMIPQLGLLQLEVSQPAHKEKLQGMQHSVRQALTKLNTLREDKSLVVTDSGMSDDIVVDVVTEREKRPDDGTLLVADTGVVQGHDELLGGSQNVKENVPKHTLYLVEKDEDMLAFMEDCLKDSYDVTTFTTADTAWEAILAQTPDAIMCAHELGGVSGSELCDRVKNVRSMERVPFILTTEGIMNAADMDAAKMSLMADDYIAQPMNLKTAIIRINKLLGEKLLPSEEQLNDETSRQADSMVLAVKLQLRQKVDEYVMQNISRPDLSIDELSRAMKVSRTMLFRKVENVTGRAPADYIRAVRLQEAAKLLSSTNISIAEIATELGFSNTGNFSYYFNLEYGMLPTEYADVSQNMASDGGTTQR